MFEVGLLLTATWGAVALLPSLPKFLQQFYTYNEL
jgi:hypothetical protein